MTYRRRWRASMVTLLAVLPVIASLAGNPAHAADDDDDDLEVSLVAPSTIICWEKPNPFDACRVTVRLSHPVRVAVTVRFATVDGTAVAPLDYRAVDERVTIPAGELTTDVALQVEDDDLRERDEWFYATISSPSVGRIGAGRVPVAIEDGSPPALG